MKYQILTNDYIQFKHPISGLPIKLFRIISLKNFISQVIEIKHGEIGGFIQSEKNLSQDDTSWIMNSAKVFDAAVLVDSRIRDDVRIFGNAYVEDSVASNRVRIFGNCTINTSDIKDNVDIYDKCHIQKSSLRNNSVICGKSIVTECQLFGGSRISGTSSVIKTKLYDQSEIKGNSVVENCILKGRTVLSNVKLLNEVREEQIELNVIT